MPEPLDLDEARATWLVQCGPCDYGMVEYGCQCPPGDYRPVLLRAVGEIEALRDQCDRMSVHGVREYANGYRDSAAHIDGVLAAGVAAPVAQVLGRVRQMLLDQAASLFREVDRAAAGGRAGNPAMEDQPPPPTQTSCDRPGCRGQGEGGYELVRRTEPCPQCREVDRG